MKEEQQRTAALIGADGLNKLRRSAVAVFGVGGVGSYAAEALVRAGVGTLYLYDYDRVEKSNLNRQLIALSSTVGLYKTEAAAARYAQINPDCRVVEKREFVTPESELPFDSFDYMIDAVDNVTAKLFLAVSSERYGVPLISVMGTGNKTDPSRLKQSDIAKTSVCPLARVMRHELKKRGVKKLEVIWSDEPPRKPINSGEPGGRIPPASMAMVPGTAGLMAAAAAVEYLIR